MTDLSKIRYRVVVMDGNGKQYDIRDYIQSLGWEENSSEIAVRISFTVRNDRTTEGYLSDLVKPGTLIGIFASAGAGEKEVARGYIETWNLVEKNSGSSLKCTCYDGLYKLQKSQDNRYYASGTGTKTAVQGVLEDWKIPLGRYDGPNVAHGKKVCAAQYLSDIILEFLDDAAKKGGEKYIIRAAGGKAEILPRGSNCPVYVFRADNTQSVSQTISTAGLVTRVQVVGQTDYTGKRSVKATLDGQTEYGIRQRIYIRGSDESLNDAKEAAQEILEGEGSIEKEMTVQSPDVPFIRKGDLVYVISSTAREYYYVAGIQHDIDACTMTMELVHADQAAGSGGTGNYKVGDIVAFHGGINYVSSYPGAKGYAARAGKARITKKDGPGKAHPWHLIHTDSSSTVYGWVDDGSFE